MSLDASIETWVGELGDRVSVSASGVQDRLLDLWGLLAEGDARKAIEDAYKKTGVLHEPVGVTMEIEEYSPRAVSRDWRARVRALSSASSALRAAMRRR